MWVRRPHHHGLRKENNISQRQNNDRQRRQNNVDARQRSDNDATQDDNACWKYATTHYNFASAESNDDDHEAEWQNNHENNKIDC
jgi:hypothetical protein